MPVEQVLNSSLNYLSNRDALDQQKIQSERNYEIDQQRLEQLRLQTGAQVGLAEEQRRGLRGNRLRDEQFAGREREAGIGETVARTGQANAAADLHGAQAAQIRQETTQKGRTFQDQLVAGRTANFYQTLRLRGNANDPYVMTQAKAVLTDLGMKPGDLEGLVGDELVQLVQEKGAHLVPDETGRQQALATLSGQTRTVADSVAQGRADIFAGQRPDNQPGVDPTQRNLQYRSGLQEVTDAAYSKMDSVVKAEYDGNWDKAAKDKDFQAYVLGIYENHPEINRMLSERPNVDPSDAGVRFSRIGNTNNFAPLVINRDGQYAPITTGGTTFNRDDPNPQTVAFGIGDLINGLKLASSQNGGSIDNFRPAFQQAEESTAPFSGRAPGVDDEKLRQLAALQAGGAKDDQLIAFLNGEAMTEASKHAEKTATEAAFSTAENAVATSAAARTERDNQRASAVARLTTATEDVFNQLGDRTADGLGTLDQHYETYRATGADRKQYGEGVTDQQIFAKKMDDDVRKTIRIPNNAKLISLELFGEEKPLDTWTDDEMTLAAQAVVMTRKDDILNKWWTFGKSRDTTGKITREALQAVKAGQTVATDSLRLPTN